MKHLIILFALFVSACTLSPEEVKGVEEGLYECFEKELTGERFTKCYAPVEAELARAEPFGHTSPHGVKWQSVKSFFADIDNSEDFRVGIKSRRVHLRGRVRSLDTVESYPVALVGDLPTFSDSKRKVECVMDIEAEPPLLGDYVEVRGTVPSGVGFEPYKGINQIALFACHLTVIRASR